MTNQRVGDEENYPKETSCSDIIKNWKKSCKILAADLAQASERQVHPSTIRRAFIRNCLHGRVAQETPLNKKNKIKRLKYA